MTARDKFLKAVMALEGEVVVWGQLDCSEVVARGVKAAGGPDQSKTHTAQTYYEVTRPLQPLERAIPGDLIFWGTMPADPCTDSNRIIHVGVILEGGKVLSADGATHTVTDLATAKANTNARVRVHNTVFFRREQYACIHRNTVVDQIDLTDR